MAKAKRRTKKPAMTFWGRVLPALQPQQRHFDHAPDDHPESEALHMMTASTNRWACMITTAAAVSMFWIVITFTVFWVGIQAGEFACGR